ncbi:MAG: hypothetical protein IIB59_07465, partial [Planctomycetes bacterium]|nr:hypothetical protein [Planctomycetota bacterium]
IGEAHMEGLGDLEAIAAEKGSILDHVRPGGLAVVNIDQPEIMPFVRRFTRGRLMTVGANPQAKLCVGGATSTLRSSSFRLEGRFDVHLPMPGAHHATNAAATFAVLDSSGVRIVENARCMWVDEAAWRIAPVPLIQIGVASGYE